MDSAARGKGPAIHSLFVGDSDIPYSVARIPNAAPVLAVPCRRLRLLKRSGISWGIAPSLRSRVLGCLFSYAMQCCSISWPRRPSASSEPAISHAELHAQGAGIFRTRHACARPRPRAGWQSTGPRLTFAFASTAAMCSRSTARRPRVRRDRSIIPQRGSGLIRGRGRRSVVRRPHPLAGAFEARADAHTPRCGRRGYHGPSR